MGATISNLNSLMALRQYRENTRAMTKSMERLATGKRINRASDDPAGLIAGTHLTAEATGIRKEMDRLEKESLTLSAKEGALSVVSDLFIQLDALVVQAANKGATTSEERDALQTQADGVLDALRHIHDTTRFNGELVFGTGNADDWATVTVESRPESDGPPGAEPAGPQLVTLNLRDLRRGGRLNLIDGDLESAQQLTGGGVKSNATERGAIGALQKNYYQSQMNSLSRELESVEGARSKIMDTDYAKEVTEMVRSQVLAEVSIQVLKVASETAASTVLGLIGPAGGGGLS